MQASLELWNHFMKVSIILLHCIEDAKGFLEIIDVVIDFISNLKQPLLKVYMAHNYSYVYVYNCVYRRRCIFQNY